MSEIIKNWLNDEVQLSKKIVNFERDFANGYLFGELLSKFNQQLNFSEFKNKDHRQALIHNYQLLEPTFKTLNIGFQPSDASKIMQGSQGEAIKILYQIKMQLEKVNNPSEMIIQQTTGKFQKPVPLKKMSNTKEIYDTMQSELFSRRLNTMTKAQKTVNLEKHLNKFEQFKEQQTNHLLKLREKDTQEDLQIKEDLRKNQIYKLQRNMAFMEDWNQKGFENWTKNMETQNLRVLKEQKFKAFNQQRLEKFKKEKQEDQKTDCLDGIDNFEKNLEKFGIIPQDSEEPLENNSQNFKKTNNSTNMVQTTNVNRLKSNKQQSDFLRKERDKRRRKMIVDQAKDQKKIEVEKREEILMEKLNQQSTQEEELQYEIYRAQQCIDVIKENRELRNERYDQKQQNMIQNEESKEKKLLEIIQQEMKQEHIIYNQRQDEIKIREEQQTRYGNYHLMKNLTDNILDIADKFFIFQQDCDQNEIEQQLIQEVYKSFQQNKHDQQFLAQEQIKDYIKGQNDWNIQIQTNPDVQQNDEKFVPQNPINNFTLGNILKYVISGFHQDREIVVSDQFASNMDYLSLRACLLGSVYSGKKQIEQFLKNTYNLECLRMEDIILEAVSGETPFQDISSTIKSLVLKGQQIPDQLLVDLFSLKIKALFPEIEKQNVINNMLEHNQSQLQDQRSLSKGWVLLDFPNTEAQAELLQTKLNNFLANDQIPVSQKDQDLQQLDILVNSDPIEIIPKQLKRSGIDCTVVINVSKDEVYQRQLGQRIHQDNRQLYHLRDNIPPTNQRNLIEKLIPLQDDSQKNGTVVSQQNFFSNELPKLRQWFQNFGFENQRENNYHEIQGDTQIDEILQQVQQIFDKTLNIRLNEYQELNQLQIKEDENRQLMIKAEEDAEEKQKNWSLYNVAELQEELQNCIGLHKLILPKQMIKNLYDLWKLCNQFYQNEIVDVFQSLNQQIDLIIHELANIQRSFLNLIQQDDQKQLLVQEFQQQYNKFHQENYDLCEEDVTKEELHQRVEDLHDKIFDIIDDKKQVLIQERQKIIDSKFLEGQLEILLVQIQRLVSAELVRSFRCLQIIQDFYQSLEKQELGELPETYQALYKFQKPTITDIESQDIQLQFAKIFVDALNLYQGEAPEQSMQKGGKAAPPKKDAKKDNAIVEKVEETELQKEMKQVINTEKQIFRYRLELLKTRYQHVIQSIQEKGKVLYQKLNQWISYSYKIENDAMNEISFILKTSIENCKQVQQEVSLQYVDVIKNYETLNFLTPPPVIQPAKEEIHTERLSISQLQLLIDEFLAVSTSGFHLEFDRVVQIINRKSNNKLCDNEFVQSLKGLSLSTIQKFTQLFYDQSTGLINGRILCTYFCLLTVPYTELDIVYYVNNLNLYTQQDLIALNDFLSVPSFFDESQRQPHEKNCNYFPREKYIKEILFHIYSHKDTINVLSFCQGLNYLLNVSQYIQQLFKNDHKNN